MVSLKILINVLMVSDIICSDKSVSNTHGQDDGRISFLDNEKKGSYVDQLQHSGQLAIQITL